MKIRGKFMEERDNFEEIDKVFRGASQLDRNILQKILLILRATDKVRSIDAFMALLEDNVKITAEYMKKPQDRVPVIYTEEKMRLDIKIDCLENLIKLFKAGVLKYKDGSFDREGKYCFTEYAVFYFSENLDRVDYFKEYVSKLIDFRNEFRFMPIIIKIDSEEGEKDSEEVEDLNEEEEGSENGGGDSKEEKNSKKEEK
jgi:hypothetical protein